MTSHALSFALKGSRQYIQGPDIFNACLNLLAQQGFAEVNTVDFALHQITETNLIATIHDTPVLELGPVLGSLKCRTSFDSIYCITLLPNTTKPEVRIPYDESWVATHCDIDLEQRRITLNQDPALYTCIETLVSMTKALHLGLFPGVNRQWIFCRWVSASWPLNARLPNLYLQLKQCLGTRLTRTEVIYQNRHVGDIYFSTR